MKNGKGALVIGVLLVAIFILPQAQKAHAGTPTIVQWTGNPIVCTSACSTTFISSVTSGNEIIVFGQANFSVCGTVTSIGDTLGTSFTAINSSGCSTHGTAGLNQFLYIGTAPASGSDQVNINYGGTVVSNGGSEQIVEVSNLPSTNNLASTGIADNGGTTTATTTDSIVMPTTYFEISAIVTGTSGCSTAQGGQTQLLTGGGASCWFNIGASIGSTSLGWGIASNIASPTNFHWTAVQAPWALNGIVFATSGGSTSIITVPCTPFELQCWLYPMFVFGIYLVLIVGMARIIKVPSQDYTGHLLEGFSIAAIVMIIFGILNILPALLITVFQVLRAIRE